MVGKVVHADSEQAVAVHNAVTYQVGRTACRAGQLCPAFKPTAPDHGRFRGKKRPAATPYCSDHFGLLMTLAV